MLNVRGPGTCDKPAPSRSARPVRRDCDEGDGCDAFIQSPPHAFCSKGFATRRALNRGSFTWPGQLAGRAIFSLPPKTMAVEDAPWRARGRCIGGDHRAAFRVFGAINE